MESTHIHIFFLLCNLHFKSQKFMWIIIIIIILFNLYWLEKKWFTWNFLKEFFIWIWFLCFSSIFFITLQNENRYNFRVHVSVCVCVNFFFTIRYLLFANAMYLCSFFFCFDFYSTFLNFFYSGVTHLYYIIIKSIYRVTIYLLIVDTYRLYLHHLIILPKR